MFFDLKPYSHQKEILEDLRLEREGYDSYKNFVVASTGSGKTLTSFKAAVLATELAGVDRVIFVVDRKDMDHRHKRNMTALKKGRLMAMYCLSGLIILILSRNRLTALM